LQSLQLRKAQAFLNLLNEFSRVRRLSTYRILIDSCRFHKGV